MLLSSQECDKFTKSYESNINQFNNFYHSLNEEQRLIIYNYLQSTYNPDHKKAIKRLDTFLNRMKSRKVESSFQDFLQDLQIHFMTTASKDFITSIK